MRAIHVKVTELPTSLQDALKSAGYGGKDIGVEARETTSVIDYGGDGKRAFIVLVDLATGRTETHMGSWGGANMFNPRNAVDLDSTERAILPGMAIIKGSEGGNRPVIASICLHPSNTAKLLPPKATVTDRQARILNTYDALTSAGRKRVHAEEMKVTAGEIDALVGLGLLKRNKAGACSITTEGKNASARNYW